MKIKIDDHEIPLSSLIIAIVALLFLYVVADIKTDISSMKDETRSINDKLFDMNGEIHDIKTALDYSRNSISCHNEVANHGYIFLNNSTKRSIAITSPVNGSMINDTVYVFGKANLSEGDYIYIITKIEKKYWISLDGSTKPNGEWRSSNECVFPDIDKNESKNFEIFAIITDKRKLIGDSSNDIPKYLAKSDPVYINVRKSE